MTCLRERVGENPDTPTPGIEPGGPEGHELATHCNTIMRRGLGLIDNFKNLKVCVVIISFTEVLYKIFCSIIL